MMFCNRKSDTIMYLSEEDGPKSSFIIHMKY
jgi:hypothetical protein